VNKRLRYRQGNGTLTPFDFRQTAYDFIFTFYSKSGASFVPETYRDIAANSRGSILLAYSTPGIFYSTSTLRRDERGENMQKVQQICRLHVGETNKSKLVSRFVERTIVEAHVKSART